MTPFPLLLLCASASLLSILACWLPDAYDPDPEEDPGYLGTWDEEP
jgi:hypothetical protein